MRQRYQKYEYIDERRSTSGRDPYRVRPNRKTLPTTLVSLNSALTERANQEYQNLCRSILRDNRFGEPLLTPMSKLVTLRKPDTQVIASDTYQFAGVYCFGRGVFGGLQRSGMDFAYKQLTRIRAGEFIYPKLMAWEGALGIVPNECDGHFVSPEFPVFAMNEERVFPEVLEVYFRSPSVWPSLGWSQYRHKRSQAPTQPK